MTEHVPVLGCGPAGLLCAWAVEEAGLTPVIYSRKEKSIIPGSQHLHGPVPGVTSPYPEGTIQFVRIGTAEGYAKKVYGDPKRETGWDNYLQVYPSWNVIKAYEFLWEHYESGIIDVEIDQDHLGMLHDEYGETIISTLPAWTICYRPQVHEFRGTPYYIKQLPTPPGETHELVVYNGLEGDPWYRWSILGGLCSIEATSDIWYGGDVVLQGTKAIDNNCNCWEGIVHRCGRWAEWRHGVTMYNAYREAKRLAERIVRDLL